MVYIITMHEVNLNGIDLNLLPPLEALLSQRNVTRAAEAVGMSQPAMSRALSRLRLLLGDPLLVRGKTGYVLTPRAQMLAPAIAAAMGGLKGVFQPSTFEPATAQRLIRIVCSDAQSVLFGPALMARLAREAPNIRVQMVPYTFDLARRMEEGSVDLAFALETTPLPAGTRTRVLGDDRLTVVMRRRHPAANRKWTMRDYDRFDHATVALMGDPPSDMDAILAKARITRKIAFTSPHFLAALAVVAKTDMITTVSEALVRRFARQFDLITKPAPFAETNLRMVLVWSQIRDHDPLLQWFRDLVADVAATIFEYRRS